MMPCGWEGNHRSGVTRATHHRLQWFIHLWAHDLDREMNIPPTISCGEHRGSPSIHIVANTSQKRTIFLTVVFSADNIVLCSGRSASAIWIQQVDKWEFNNRIHTTAETVARHRCRMWLVEALAYLVHAAGSMQWLGIHPSICLSVTSISSNNGSWWVYCWVPAPGAIDQYLWVAWWCE